ncbi:MAG TPA: ABC transporter ATP-binding protein [Gemmataceae bacterium]|jgi:lipopolysaccharide transport system ATP-binding protein
MPDAIRALGVSKQYRLGSGTRGGFNTLTETLAGAPRRLLDRIAGSDANREVRDVHFWALKDVSFDVKPGEAVGIIGKNGAGKSTLLKILARIVEPTAGRVELRGRIGSLLEVGTGFHPELTGRENIFLNGSILGMSRREIAGNFDAIVAFSEIEQFIDTPVKRYSSGMYIRLAFAVAAHLDPEVLIVDEVLAVGDATFQRRCIDRMRELAAGGRTILFVSHNMDLIPRLCRRAVLLDRGQVADAGDAGSVTQAYLTRLVADARGGDLRDKPRSGDGRARFVRAALIDNAGQPTHQFTSGSDLTIRMEIESSQAIPSVAAAVVLRTLYGMRAITSWTQEAGFAAGLEPGMQTLECRFRDVPLRPGHTVLIDLWLAAGAVLDSVEGALIVDVAGDERHAQLSTNADQGIVVCDYQWRKV